MKTASFSLVAGTLLAATVLLAPCRVAAQTTFALWDWNSTASSNYNLPKIGAGTVTGYGQTAPSPPLANVLVNGSPEDPGTVLGGTNYNRSANVNPPLLTAANNSVGIGFGTPTTGSTDAVKITWSQTVGFRSSRFWQILVSTNGTNGTFFKPTGGIGSSVSQLVNGYNSSTNLISGTATVEVDAGGLIDFRTINGNWLTQNSSTVNPLPTPLAAGFVDEISYTLATGAGYENNPDFAFAIVGAWDPDLSATSGTNGLVSSFAGLDSTDLVNGYNRALGSGGGARIDLMTVTSVPEPSTYALLALAAACLGARILRRRG